MLDLHSLTYPCSHLIQSSICMYNKVAPWDFQSYTFDVKHITSGESWASKYVGQQIRKQWNNVNWEGDVAVHVKMGDRERYHDKIHQEKHKVEILDFAEAPKA